MFNRIYIYLSDGVVIIVLDSVFHLGRLAGGIVATGKLLVASFVEGYTETKDIENE